MKIQVLTNVRADDFFLALWVHYYGEIFGRENLHVQFDGDDWSTDVDLSGVNVHIVNTIPRERQGRLRKTSRWQSGFANGLLRDGVDLVLRTDIDEFVAADPLTGRSLPEHLALIETDGRIAALGLDVIQHADEGALDPGQPILSQRRNAILTREFSKLVAVRAPLRWKSGFHRGRDVPIDVDADLLLFHLALFDKDQAERRVAGRSAIVEHQTQGAHIAGRLDRFDDITGSDALDFDAQRPVAHTHLMKSLPSPTGPHLGKIPDGNVERGYHVRLPDRLTAILPKLDDFWPATGSR